MDQWLQKQLDKAKHPWVRTGSVFIKVLLAILSLVTVLSDTGFADQVVDNRLKVWAGAVVVASFAALVGDLMWYHSRLRQSKAELQRLQASNSTIEAERDELKEQLDSALELIGAQRVHAQELLLDDLERAALLGVMADHWATKGAQVERFRVERGQDGQELSPSQRIGESVTVIINIGKNDRVTSGMQFVVEDPTDRRPYGVIVVDEAHDEGAHCRVVEILEDGFWIDALESLQQNRPCVKDLSANRIVPRSPLPTIDSANAQKLLDWVRNVREASLG